MLMKRMKMLTPDLKLKGIESYTINWINLVHTPDFLERVITGNESWFYEATLGSV